MRTLDPELWSKNLKKPAIEVTRMNKFGKHPGHRYERILRKSLVDTAQEFWENCSIPHVKLINVKDISKFERYCYILLLFLSLGSGIAIVTYACRQFYTTPPLVVTGLPSKASIAQVNFPAVALCSNNIISKTALDNYTDYLYNHPKNHINGPRYTRTVIEENLLKFGELLMMALPPLQLHFDKFLTDVDPHFNVTDVMFRFTPPCASILDRCSWRGRQLPCDALFAFRVTPLGFCCVFNSRYYPVDANNKPYILDLIGYNYGLGVVITENRDDFKFVRRNTYGPEMLLFEGSEYPLLESGDVRMYPLPRNYSLQFNVNILTQHVNDDVKYFSESWRGCRTAGEGLSRCLTRCRREAAAALCGCAPHALLADSDERHARECSLRDLHCLSNHREKLLNLLPSTFHMDETRREGGFEELNNGIYCPKCLVLCKRQMYSATISYAQYKEGIATYKNFLTEGLLLINSTTIRMFYASDHYKRLELDVYVRWYEVLAFLSTEWMVFVGASVVVVVEVFYFFTFRWIHHFLRRKRLGDFRSPSI